MLELKEFDPDRDLNLDQYIIGGPRTPKLPLGFVQDLRSFCHTAYQDGRERAILVRQNGFEISPIAHIQAASFYSTHNGRVKEEAERHLEETDGAPISLPSRISLCGPS